jgi:hypothetical protein
MCGKRCAICAARRACIRTDVLDVLCQMTLIARYLVQAWDVRNTCKHSGAVLPLPSAPVGRGVDGIDAMA